MTKREVVAAFDQTRSAAAAKADWQVKLWYRLLQRRTRRQRSELNLAKLKAVESVLLRRQRSGQ